MAKPISELKHKDSTTPDGKYYTKVQLDWIPMAASMLERLGWDDGTELEAFIMYNDQIVIRRKGALSAGSTD